MQIFRIEHKAHRVGPYNCYSYLGEGVSEEAASELEAMVWAHGEWDDDTHPLPEFDGIGPIYNGEKLGFASLDQLRAWFTAGELRTMEACGFVLSELMCGDDFVRVGGKQVAFEPERAVRMSERLPSDVIA